MNNSEIKIMKPKPSLTDDEIRSHMDFDKLLLLSKSPTSIKSKPSWLKSIYWTGAGLIVASSAYYFIKVQDNSSSLQNNSPEPTSIVTDSMETSNSQTKTNDKKGNAGDSTVQMIAKPVPKNIKPATTTDAVKVEEPKLDSTKKQSYVQFTEAEPVAGYANLYEYFSRELTYPEEIAKDSIEGTVVVSFVIDEGGVPGEIKITNSLGELFDQESIRVIKNMPQWKAATINGNPTATRLSIPLTFKILK